MRFGWSQFRKYYDDTGGFYPSFTPPSIDLNRDLHVDDGRAWADFGLALPNWPRLVFGYEYQYRDGTEATLLWGPVSNGSESKAIYPAFKDLSEKVHILKFDLDYARWGVGFNDSFRGQWYNLGTYELNENAYTNRAPGASFMSATEKQTYFQGANTFHLERQFTDWLFGSGGYLYSKLNSEAALEMDAVNPMGLDANQLVPALGWTANGIQLERESHVFSLSALLGPWKGLSLSFGTQNEWSRQSGLGNVATSIFVPNYFGIDTNMISSSLDRRTFSQDVGIRFTKIPFTTLFGEARFQRDDVGQFEEDLNQLTQFLRDSDTISKLTDFRAGFNTSPWRRVSFSAQYRRYDNETDYTNLRKEIPATGNQGYPGFIREREILSDDAEAKLAVQMTPWLKTSLSYQWLANEYHTATDSATSLTSPPFIVSPGGGLLAGTYNAHIASVNAVLTPWRRLFLSTTFAYQNARTITEANGVSSVAPYAGNIYSAMLSGNYALNAKTDLVANYSFSTADFAQETTGLPLGITYHQHALQAGIKRHLTKDTTLGLQYRFYWYDEPSSGGINDFQAHAVFATLVCRFR
jgi:hypothetical protein